MVSWPWHTQTLPEQEKKKLSVLAKMTCFHRMHGMKSYSTLNTLSYLEVGSSKFAEGESADVLGQFSGRVNMLHQLPLHFC